MTYVYLVNDSPSFAFASVKMYTNFTDAKLLKKRMKHFSDDMFETKGRQFLGVDLLGNTIYRLSFAGRDIYFKCIGRK